MVKEIRVRLANVDDTSKIVDVLKQSLGESFLPKSDKIWIYKHFENPLGRSIIVVAEIDNKIVGVRAFMKWIWGIMDRELSTFRAVDTAVLPEYQRKGIFKLMNDYGQLVVRENRGAFIFNTPNSNSLHGNLKMGAQKLGKIPISIKLINPLFHAKKKSDLNGSFPDSKLKMVNTKLINSGKYFVPKSKEYLTWRYEKNPLRDYIILENTEFYIAAYIRKHKFFNELRIVEKICLTSNDEKKADKIILKLAKENRIFLITGSINNFKGFTLKGNYGPILVAKKISENFTGKNGFDSVMNWHINLGDLELF